MKEFIFVLYSKGNKLYVFRKRLNVHYQYGFGKNMLRNPLSILLITIFDGENKTRLSMIGIDFGR
jgi:hypothetical protein